MSTLQHIFEDLSHGEFSQLQLGSFDPDQYESEPDPRQYAQINSYLNSALRAIYSKFWLRSDEAIIQLSEETEIYRLDYRHALSNTASNAAKYIMDTVADPFLDNVLNIEQIYNEGGELVCLNDDSAEVSYYTPSYNTVQVPWPNDDNSIAVVYRATHPRINFSIGDRPEDIYIDIPPQLHDALLFYVASRFHSGNGASEGKDTLYFQRFTEQCTQVRESGLFIQPTVQDWRFERYGWV
jgi:hypothetical protein